MVPVLSVPGVKLTVPNKSGLVFRSLKQILLLFVFQSRGNYIEDFSHLIDRKGFGLCGLENIYHKKSLYSDRVSPSLCLFPI